MKTRNGIWMSAVALVLLVSSLTPSALAGAERFALVRAVPDDVFLCIAGKHNPDRAFINAYWGEVFTALQDCGIGTDLMAMFSGAADADTQAEFERLKTLATQLVDGVHWDALVQRELVFAERWAPSNPAQPKIIAMGPPEMLMLCAMDASTAAENYAGLAEILATLAREVNQAAETSVLALERTELHGCPATTLVVQNLPPQAPDLWLGVAQHDDVLLMGFGRHLFAQSLGLLAGQKQPAALGDAARYQAAFAQLPPTHESATFFDVHKFLSLYQRMARELPPMIAGDSVKDVVQNSTQTGRVHELNMQAWAAYEDGDYEQGLKLVQEAYALAPQDSRVLYYLACFHALTGSKDQALDFLERAVAGGFHSPGHIARDPDLKSLRDDPRYAAALEKARDAAQAASEVENSAWAHGVTAVAQRLLDAVGIIDYVAAVEYTQGHAVHSESVAVLVPDAAQRPIFPVLAADRQMEDFAHFLPEETLSFSVTAGPDLAALHKFLRDTVRAFGPQGEAGLAWWDQFQQEIGFDVQRDVLSWLDGDSVSVTLKDGQGSAWFVKVTDEQRAREKMDTLMEFLTERIGELAAANPALAMLSAVRSPATDARLEGFENLQFMMTPQPIVWGVADGHVIIGTNPDAIVLCLETAAGRHPGVRKNPRVMAEAVLPEGRFDSVALTDLRGLGDELAEMLGMVTMASGMMGMFIPDQDARAVLMQVSKMVGKLTPVVRKIDFYKSSATCTTFDGKTLHTRGVTHYVPPAERDVVETTAR